MIEISGLGWQSPAKIFELLFCGYNCNTSKVFILIYIYFSISFVVLMLLYLPVVRGKNVK